jgi:Undecaprenyl-phosphate glucose phosphotransferase
MIPSKLAIQQIALKAGLYSAYTAAFWLAFWLRFYSGLINIRLDMRPSGYVILYLVSTVAFGALCRFAELDQLWVASDPTRWVRGAVSVTAATLAVVFFGAFFVRSFSFSRLFMVILGFLNLGLVVIMPRLLLMLAHWHSHEKEEVKVLIVGDADHAKRVAERVRENSWVRCGIVGYLASDERRDGAVPCLGGIEDLESVCHHAPLDEILVALPLAQLGQVPELKRVLDRVSVPSRLVCDFLDEVASSSSIFEFFGISVVNLHRNPVDSLVYGLLKRSFDLVVATGILALLWPLMTVIAILIKLTSPGPALFSQRRVGLHGREFIMYKFRTMCVQDQESADLGRTSTDDPRRTGLGALLRRVNLDELPQLWNVIRGDMSLVGPRPEVPHYVDKYSDEVAEYNVRHFLRSGITGWAQVNGWRGQTSIVRRIECDLYYLKNWSFWLDLKILWLTLWRGFRDKNAY